MMERPRREGVEFGFVETRRATRKMGEVDHRGEFVERNDRARGFRRPHQHRERGDRKRLDAFLASEAIESAPVRLERPSPPASVRRL
jgi:hypothetical protein